MCKVQSDMSLSIDSSEEGDAFYTHAVKSKHAQYSKQIKSEPA